LANIQQIEGKGDNMSGDFGRKRSFEVD